MTTYFKLWNATYLEAFEKYKSIIDENKIIKQKTEYVFTDIMGKTHELIWKKCKNEIDILNTSNALVPMVNNIFKLGFNISMHNYKNVVEFNRCKFLLELPIFLMFSKLANRWDSVDQTFTSCINECNKVKITDDDNPLYRCFVGCFSDANINSHKVKNDFDDPLTKLRYEVDRLNYEAI